MKIKTGLFICILLLQNFLVNAQLETGIYDNGLKLAFNPSTNVITGIFENYSGYDNKTGDPAFSCIFYIHGLLKDSTSRIETYFPLDKKDDLVIGKIKLIAKDKISIKLDDEHGGCWNVMSFDDFTNFKLRENKIWIEIRYIAIEKAFFHSEKDQSTKRKAYVLKGDLVFIDKIDSEWVHCSYHGKTVTTGWLKPNSVNKD